MYMCIHVHEFINLYVNDTCTVMNIYSCMYILQTRLYRDSFTTTLHFPSGPISLATLASLSSQSGQFQRLKGAKEDHVVTEVIRATAVGPILLGSPTLWTQVAGKEKLGTSIPTVLQWNILGNLLNAVRILRDNQDGVLRTTKLDIKI